MSIKSKALSYLVSVKIATEIPTRHKLIRDEHFAAEVAEKYWRINTKTHSNMSLKEFERFYRGLIDVIKPSKEDTILDAGCGSGEIAGLFQKDGFKIHGFDRSEKLIKLARERFGDIFFVDDIENMQNKTAYTKVFLNGAWQYIHPHLYEQALRNLYNICEGCVFITDNPDFDKRQLWYNNRLAVSLTSYFPVYDSKNAGFWVKDFSNLAKKVGFSRVEKIDSWAYYRSHYILNR
jgi:SAM-dependent methyltransferase